MKFPGATSMVNKVMVTGATGFVGKPLVQQLSKNNQYVVRAVARIDITGLFEPNVEMGYVNDIDADTDWTEALTGCDTVIHTAARVHVMKEHADDPLAEFRRVNLVGTLNLARQAVQQGVSRFIFISSIKVNGESTAKNNPFTPEAIPQPEDAYAISKYEAEEGLRALAVETGLDVVVIRPPLIYGPAVKGNFQRMMKWLINDLPLPLGKIPNKRSFVAVDNLINLITLCITHPQAANQLFLASDGEDLSTSELLQRMGRALGKKTRLLPVPFVILRAGAALIGKQDMLQRLCGSLQIDASKAYDLLGWKPVTQVDEALHRTAQHYLHDQK